jgi:hypothetical protein
MGLCTNKTITCCKTASTALPTKVTKGVQTMNSLGPPIRRRALRLLARCVNDTWHRVSSDVASILSYVATTVVRCGIESVLCGTKSVRGCPRWHQIHPPWRPIERQRYGDRLRLTRGPMCSIYRLDGESRYGICRNSYAQLRRTFYRSWELRTTSCSRGNGSGDEL